MASATMARGVTKNRVKVLEDFGKVVATDPTNTAAIQASLEQVAAEGGRELCLEAIGTATLFLTITKVVDATGRQPVNEAAYSIGAYVARVWRMFS